MNGFDRDEDICTAKATYLFEGMPSIRRYKFNPKGSRIDCYATGVTEGNKEIKMAIELKNRHFLHTDFEKEGWILENEKYDALLAAKATSGYTPIYLNFFTDDCYCLWQIDKIKELDCHNKKCSKTTAENYHKGEVDKERIFLKISQGKLFPFHYDKGRDN